MYETAPISALTGAFSVKEAIKTSVPEAVALAAAEGVDISRAATYYGERESGWVVRIGLSVRFRHPITLSELKDRDHYFTAPQTFAYLSRFEGLTQDLLYTFQAESQSAIILQQLSEENRNTFIRLVRSEVGSAYEDIDDDFLNQILDDNIGLESAFSTRGKYVLEAVWGEHIIGFTVLTEKIYRAWKSGPTILLPEFRGFGLGQALRKKIQEFCVERGAIGIYCTCAESRPAVVSYLLNSGMVFQARLREHLSKGRDELVFIKKLSTRTPPVNHRVKVSNVVIRGSVIRATAKNLNLDPILNFFLQQMPRWYFNPGPNLSSAIRESLVSLESGITRYSAKGRILYGFVNDRGRPIVCALLTSKRSNMAKINLVATVESPPTIKRLLTRLLSDARNYRRIYLTVPVWKVSTTMVLLELGFRFEGILQDPFGTGIDHACYGYIKSG
jgi:predicted transcriptional regulator/GNAT superfamily N-acetyltransferase